MDYIIQQNGVLSSEYMLPILEKQVVSAYLNGGSLTTMPIYESSMDVMTPEGANLSAPNRVERADGAFIQRKFGGSRVSEFNSDKQLKVYGEMNAHNPNANDGHALIIKLDNRREAVMTGDGTLYIDGYMIRDGRIYDMNKSMSVEIDKSFERTDLERGDILLEHFEYAKRVQKEFNDKITVNDRVSDAIKKAEQLRNDESIDGEVWLAALETRQPRNQAGDLVITKVEGIAEGRGNVHETNMMDAYQVLDSDNDFDKVTTYTSSDPAVWGEAARLAGHTVFARDVDIQTFMSKTLEHFNGGRKDFEMHAGNIVSTGDIRSRKVIKLLHI